MQEIQLLYHLVVELARASSIIANDVVLIKKFNGKSMLELVHAVLGEFTQCLLIPTVFIYQIFSQPSS